MSFYEQLILTLVGAILHEAVKNPGSFKRVEGVFIRVRDDATLAVAALDPSAPPPPGYKPV